MRGAPDRVRGKRTIVEKSIVIAKEERLRNLIITMRL
jgi:hypothetical protein